LLERIKIDHRGTTFIMTANDVAKLDKALLRPGRIDTVVSFSLPSPADREEILSGYLDTGRASKDNIQQLVVASEGLTADYLREAAVRCNRDTPEEAITYLKSIREIVLAKTA
jgi:ATP-dependent 26S proteasome regulatory subunit